MLDSTGLNQIKWKIFFHTLLGPRNTSCDFTCRWAVFSDAFASKGFKLEHGNLVIGTDGLMNIKLLE